MTYVWKSGARFSVSAEVAGKVCEDLESKGRLTARNLVEASKPEGAPLHKCFEWDDEKAGRLYREDQARNIIRHIVVEEEDRADGEENPYRYIPVFQNLRNDDHTYEHIKTIVKDEDKRETLLSIAKSEMISFKNKYIALRELAKVFAAMDEVLEGGDE